nr:hypothetical protein [Bacteroidota bacterium]
MKKESLPSENTDQSIHAEKKGKRSDEKRAASNNAAHPEQVTEPLAPEPESLPEMLVEDSESEELTFVEDAIEADILAEEIAVAARGSSRANDSNEIFVIGGLEQSMNVQPVTSEKNGMGRTTVTSNFNESIGAGSQNEITAFGADKNATPGQTIQMADAKARPVCGMETYEKYLESKAILPTDHPRNKEVVKVLVKINDIGAFTGFENLNQADSLLFEKAKEIIHNGPEWQPEISNGIQVYSEAKIKVTFKKAE